MTVMSLWQELSTSGFMHVSGTTKHDFVIPCRLLSVMRNKVLAFKIYDLY